MAARPHQRFIYRPHRRSVTCEWCGQRWSVGDFADSPASPEIWIDDAQTILCPDCLQPEGFAT